MGEQTRAASERPHFPETYDDRAFDTMLRLLIMMEGELQTKEAIIEVLMEGRSKDVVLLNKLNKLLGVRETDPFSALRRDGVYSHQKWSELFMNENDRDHAVLADSSRYLSACSSLRAISVARLQNQRYSEAYEMLQKTVKSYRKLKVKYTKERRKSTMDAQPTTSPVSEVLDPSPRPVDVTTPCLVVGRKESSKDLGRESEGCRQLEQEQKRDGELEQQTECCGERGREERGEELGRQDKCCEELEREKTRCRNLEQKVEELTRRMEEEHKQTTSIEKQMRNEIWRLTRELRQEREYSKKNHCRLLITARRSEPAVEQS